MQMRIGQDRIRALQLSGLLCELTKLYGLEEIGYIAGWSEGKVKGKLDELQNAGVIFQERIGSPPTRIWCSYPCLILRFMSLKGQKKEIV